MEIQRCRHVRRCDSSIHNKTENVSLIYYRSKGPIKQSWLISQTAVNKKHLTC